MDYIIPLDVVSVHTYVEYVPLGDLKSFYQDETSFIKGFIKRKKAECIFSKGYIFTYILVLTYSLAYLEFIPNYGGFYLVSSPFGKWKIIPN